jgi:kinesin family protein C2/C3
MFVHVSPDEESYGETVSTLTFAKRVASVELGASSKNSESAELRESREKVRVGDQIPFLWTFLQSDTAS